MLSGLKIIKKGNDCVTLHYPAGPISLLSVSF